MKKYSILTKYKIELDSLSEVLNDVQQLEVLNYSDDTRRLKEKLKSQYIYADKLYFGLSCETLIFTYQYKEIIDLISIVNDRAKEFCNLIILRASDDECKIVMKRHFKKLTDKYRYIISNTINTKAQIPLKINKFIKSVEEYLEILRALYSHKEMQSFAKFGAINESVMVIESFKLNLVSQFKRLSIKRRKCDYVFYLGKNSLPKVNKDIKKSEVI